MPWTEDEIRTEARRRRRPPKLWLRSCARKARGAADPVAACAETWHHRMGVPAREHAMRVERLRETGRYCSVCRGPHQGPHRRRKKRRK